MVTLANLPPVIAPPELEGLKDTQPDTYKAIQAAFDAIQAQQLYQAGITSPDVRPIGPHSTTIVQVGGSFVLGWTPDEGGSTVDDYEVWRAPAGTRNVPTSPQFQTDGATKIATIPDSGGCLPVGSGYSFIDRNFTIPNLDPANPARFAYWIRARSGGVYSNAIAVTGTPIEVTVGGAGDQTPEPKWTPKNLLFNANFQSSAGGTSVPIRDNFTLSNATNATPIVCTTVRNHGYSTGEVVYIATVLGNLAANGLWTVTVTGLNTFSLNTSVGSGAYTSGGICYWTDGQPTPATLALSAGVPRWSPWCRAGTFSVYSLLLPNPVFRASGGLPTGEILFAGGLATGPYQIEQDMTGLYISAGQKLTLSVYARLGGPAGGAQASTTITMNAYIGGTSALTATFNGSVLTQSWKRLAWTFVVPGVSGSVAGGGFSFQIQNQFNAPPPACPDFILTRPMLNVGDAAAPWINDLDQLDNYLANAGLSDPLVASWARGVSQQLIIRDASAPYV